MENSQKINTNTLAEEALEIVTTLIAENELVHGEFIFNVKLNSSKDTIIVKDISGKELHYNLSEVSCIFTDSIDMLGSFTRNAFKTVMNSEQCFDYEEKKNAFLKSYSRLREIEKQI